MKTKQLQEMRKESVESMTAKIAELKMQIAKIQMPRLGETPTNVKIASGLKRDIAQIKTLITESQSKQK